MRIDSARNLQRVALAAFGLAVGASSSRAQAPGACTYDTCALSIAPRWNGLAVVRGISGAEVANLNFFLPRDISAPFYIEGPKAPAALGEVRRAVRLRRVAAAFTDAGMFLLAAGAVRALDQRRIDAASGTMLSTGTLAFAVSVPLQFAADGALSRAVFLYNRRFAP